MSTAWETAKELAEKHNNQGGLFVKLANNGDKVTGAFCGEPYAREVHWVTDHYEECLEEGCPHCESGLKASLKVSLNFYVPEEQKMKVIEGGVNWFKSVIKVEEKYGFDKRLFEIERNGDKGNPKTTYSILPDAEIDEELGERMAITDLHDLAGLATKKGDQAEQTQTDADGAISAKVSGEFKAQLKVLPTDKVNEFLEAFDIKRIAELPAKDEAKARAFLNEMTKPEEEIDPFE